MTAAITTPAHWLGALRTECDRTSQAQVAQRLGVSGTTVSQVLSGTYAANPIRIERRVRGELMGAQCNCPVMGDVSTRVCQDVQERTPGKNGAGIGNPPSGSSPPSARPLVTML